MQFPPPLFPKTAVIQFPPTVPTIFVVAPRRACLFHLPEHDGGASSPPLRLRDEARVRRCQEANLRFMERAPSSVLSGEEMRRLLGGLDAAVAFFQSRADFFSGPEQRTADVLRSTHALALPASTWERRWLRGQVALIKEVADEIPFAPTRCVGYFPFSSSLYLECTRHFVHFL